MTDPTVFDIVIRGGSIVDGSGAARFAADVAIDDDRIRTIGSASPWRGRSEIDATGKVVAPGFIDVHTHDDRLLLSSPEMAPKVSQGVTTVVTGNCGVSLAPLPGGLEPPPPLNLLGDRQWYRFDGFADYLRALDEAPAATNAACLVGHSTLRVGALGGEGARQRQASAGEIAAMRRCLSEALEAGAIGFSTGLFYDIGFPASASEVIALCEPLAEAGGIYTTHMRDEGDGVLDSLKEALDTARNANVPIVISHHKVQGRNNFGRTLQTLAMIDAARRTRPVAVDVYPYAASSTVLSARSHRNSTRTVITWSKARPDLAGRSLDEIAKILGCGDDEAIDRLQPAGAIYHSMDEADVRRILAHPDVMVGSDGLPHDAQPHPRLWGTFPRVLGHYVRTAGLFGLEEAVHRMTGVPARVFGLTGRGSIAAGAYADLVVFDPDLVADRATFDDPCRPAAGIHTVMTNGRAVWRGGAPTGARPGRVLRRQALQQARGEAGRSPGR